MRLVLKFFSTAILRFQSTRSLTFRIRRFGLLLLPLLFTIKAFSVSRYKNFYPCIETTKALFTTKQSALIDTPYEAKINRETDTRRVVLLDLIGGNSAKNSVLRQDAEIAKRPFGSHIDVNSGSSAKESAISIKNRRFERQEIIPSQEYIDVTGLVQDSMKNPMGSVAVREIINGKATRKVTKSNEHGIFLLKAVAKNAFLEFSHVGYQTIRIQVTEELEPVTLKLETANIEEVVVTGIFERSKESFTGAVRTITAEEIRKSGNQNALNALTLLEPSIQAVQNLQNGSDPNNMPQLRLRGASSLPSSANLAVAGTSQMDIAYGNRVDQITNQYAVDPNLPLFILDGFQVPLTRINDLDINEVKSMTVLKDASATAIYGSLGASGVIVVERFKPTSGGVVFKYYADLTYETPDLRAYQLLNAEEKLLVEQLAGVYSSRITDLSVDLQQAYNLRLQEVLRGRDTYWPALPLQNAFKQRHRVTMEGGHGDMTYGLNFTYNANPGVMKGSKRDVYNAESFLNYRTGKFQLSNQLNIQVANATNSPWGIFSQYTAMNPYYTPYDENGNISLLLQRSIAGFQNAIYGDVYNPVYNTTLNGRDLTNTRNLTNNTAIEYKFNQQLSLRGRISITSQTDDSEVFLPAEHTSFRNTAILDRGSLTVGNGNLFSYDANVDLNYNLTVGKHQIYSTVNTRLHENSNENIVVQVRGLPSSLTDYVFYARNYEGNRPTGSESTVRQVGFLGNANYTYDSRYFADVSYRLDGSSAVGSDRLFAPFGSVGLGWNLHREKFLQKAFQRGFINELRLRSSIGLTGAQQYQPYEAIRTYDYFLRDVYVNSVGASLLGIGNDELTWQKTQKYNAGLNFTMLDSRLNLVADYFYDFTNGFTTQFNLQPSSGFETYTGNLGSIISTGFEASLSVMAIKPKIKNGLGLTFIANVGNSKSIIHEITEELRAQNDLLQSQTSATLPIVRYEEGQSLDALWVVPSLGIDPATGEEMFLKKDGTVSYVWNVDDVRPLGISSPKFQGTFGINLSYAKFQLNAYFAYRYGGQLYNTTLLNKVENIDLVNNADSRVLTRRWQQPGDVTPFRALTFDGTQRTNTNATSRFLQHDNQLTLSSASLLYRLDDRLVKAFRLRNLNLGLYMNDVFQLSSIQIERGTAYPFARNVSFSLQASF